MLLISLQRSVDYALDLSSEVEGGGRNELCHENCVEFLGRIYPK